MQSNSTPLPAPEARASTTTSMGGGRQASTSGAPGKSKAGHGTYTRTPWKPSISKVILRTVANKGTSNLVSLATLKSAVAAMGYDIIRNAWRVKRALKKLVDQGMLRQVTGKGAMGSFRLGKKSSKPKLKAKGPPQQRSRRRQAVHRRPRQCRAGHRGRPGRRPSRQRRSLLGSKQGHQRLGSMARQR
ncbi:histone H1.9-like isoform X1 [Cavia porcellus]|uniref:histone H1.9-like isoform X1 n=1 Tax=Cavia porcellus TaxID=10141 RepID=UPI000661C2BB|nr:spermatid-specific linker histone H1-like protein [Cavia porcellus]